MIIVNKSFNKFSYPVLDPEKKCKVFESFSIAITSKETGKKI